MFETSVSFKIYPTPEKRGKHYFNVIVFQTKKEMWDWWAAYKKMRGDQGGDLSKCHGEREFAAMCVPYERLLIHSDGTEEQHNDIGTLIFHRKRLGAGIISHECNHAALWWDRLVNGNTEACYGRDNGDHDGAEERMNYGLYYLVRDCVNNLYKKKLI